MQRVRRQPGFTLIELLVVVAIIGMLAGMLIPVVVRARVKGQMARCAANLRQLYFANAMFADDHGYYVPAASDILSSNLKRWHGARSNAHDSFDGSKGPLASYLGGSSRVRECPGFLHFRTDESAANTFESSCGGYGYNDRGVGSQLYVHGYCQRALEKGMPAGSLKDPSQTVMFCDTAFPQPYSHPEYLIEYSFAEAYHFVTGDPPAESSAVASPSIHFRHGGRANVVWCDGHVSAEELTTESTKASFTEYDIGWFGPPDNSLFDPY